MSRIGGIASNDFRPRRPDRYPDAAGRAVRRRARRRHPC